MLSVIIPVYNVENYLNECLDSVTSQTLEDMEIICIDDGSTDNSPDILKEYSKKDKRIKIITKENGGQATARNLGIKEAQGEYIAFVDSDDFIEPTMFEKLYTKAKDNNLDIAMCKIATYDNQTEEIKDNVWYYMLGVFRDFEKDIFNHKDTKEFTCHIAVTPYNKIYKTTLLKENNILFPEGLIFEDEKFFYDTYLRAKRVSIVDEFLYYYRINRKGSTVDTIKDNDFSDIVPISKLIRETFKETDNYEDYKILLSNRFIHLQLARFTQTSQKYKETFFNLLKSDLEEVLADRTIYDNLESDVKLRVDKIINSESLNEFEKLDEDKVFSVVMACYNAENHLDETINSLLGQSFSFGSNIQLILVDDGSTDKTAEICLKYQNQYPDNIIYLHQENKGQGAARNFGLKYVKGKYINFLDSDDKFSGNTFYSVYEFFEKHYDEIDFVSVPIFFFDKAVGQHPLNYKFEEDKIIDLNKNWDYPQLSSSSAFFKKELFDNYSFKTDFVNSEDSLMINKMLIDNPIYGVVKDAIYWYRKRTNDASTIDSSTSKKDFYIDRLKRYFKELINYSKEKYGNVAKFIQYLIVYDLQWMFIVEDVSEILTAEEIKEVYIHIQDILSEIEDEVILSLRDDKLNISHHMLATKYATVNVNLNKEVYYENIHSNYNNNIAGVYCENTLIDKLDKHRLWLDIIEIKGNTLYISGFLMSFFDDEDVKIEISKNGKIYPTTTVYYHNNSKKFLNCSLESQFNFDCEIPLENKENSKVEIYARFIGENSDETSKWKLPIGFADYARLSELSNYSICGNYFLKFNDNDFYISRYNYFKMIKSEIPILLRVLKRKESYYTSILFFRFVYLLLYPFYRKKRIWLFMDRQENADDNAEHLYKYAVTQKDNIKKYFTVSDEFGDFTRLSNLPNVLEFYSIKQRLVYLFAEKIISSHPDENILNPFMGKNVKSYSGLINSDKIFLQHGVTKDNVSSWLHKSDKNLKLITTVSDAERKSFLDPGYNYDENIIQTLGFPRFDNLKTNEKTKRQILIAPSWRTDLHNMTIKYIMDSDYFKTINSLINNKTLISIAEKYDYKIIFKPHPMVYGYVDLFETNEYVTIDEKTTYQELFKDSDLLITDYSSIAFDFSYMKKPIIYYQHDNDYNFKEGYFKYKTMGFGDVITDENILIGKIEEYLKNDCKIEEIYTKRVNSFYKYNDKNNCKRVYDATLNLKD
ncbi:glycosyltransferase [uncultured Methanobrevibacter sp.]|uniref:bifunctional glycosyltransferase/CDP-glycerol:glycerophosphate glycerophosphotransferase n=1 Tax=uncultured Methanobrevibacter sp. TaxID=253161 RepID=UPI0025CFEE92|nr:glycosyltransferase [uncultured Methanobrevibacter sp.]